MTWPQEENGGPVAFTKDGKSVYVQSSLGYDTTRLLQVYTTSSVLLSVLLSVLGISVCSTATQQHS